MVFRLPQSLELAAEVLFPRASTCTDAQAPLQALNMHRDAAQEGHAEAHDAVLASLQCMQALTSGGGGMDAAIAAPDFVQCLCSVLDPDDQDCSKLVVEMLTKLCLYSADGYCAAIQVSISSMQYVHPVRLGMCAGVRIA